MNYRQFLIAGEQMGLRYALALPQATLAGQRGEKLGRHAGSSVDFQDYRDYQPGDDLRHIDWNAYARTDQLTVKLFREEVQPHLDLILDTSSSMALTDSPKAQALHQLAALFTTAAANARCSHAVWVTGEGFQRVANDTQPPSAWGELPLGGARSFEEAHGLLPRVCGGRESVLSLAISFGPATPCPPCASSPKAPPP